MVGMIYMYVWGPELRVAVIVEFQAVGMTWGWILPEMCFLIRMCSPWRPRWHTKEHSGVTSKE